MAMPDHASVDAYIAAQREDVRPLLEALRAAVRRAGPRLDETISYKIPTYQLGGRAVVFFAAWKAHLSMYPANAAVFEAVPELLPLKQAKDTVRLDLDLPLPTKLVARFVKVRIAEVERELADKQKGAPKQAAPKRSR
jgi:uncharacterized protein YdhG (YjbR/CyaY superfamily)